MFLFCFMFHGRSDFFLFGSEVHFVFLLVEFYCTISIYYKILRNYVYYFCILNRIVWAVETSVLFRARFTCFHTHTSLHNLFVCFFVLFHSCCSHVRVFGRTIVHELAFSYSRTEWYVLFSYSDYSRL